MNEDETEQHMATEDEARLLCITQPLPHVVWLFGLRHFWASDMGCLAIINLETYFARATMDVRRRPLPVHACAILGK